MTIVLLQICISDYTRSVSVELANSYLTLDDDDTSEVIYSNSSRVLQYISSKLPHKLTVLIEYLYLVCGASLCHYYVSCKSYPEINVLNGEPINGRLHTLTRGISMKYDTKIWHELILSCLRQFDDPQNLGIIRLIVGSTRLLPRFLPSFRFLG